MRPGPNGKGLSRKAILTEIDHSLRRLGTDYIDLYQIHRNDPGTPLEETLEVLHDVVKAGKVRYLGASSMHAWEFAKALHLQRQHGWARFVSVQDHYNLLAREEEHEMLPLCADEGVGTIVWSPLARGRLARPWQDAKATARRSAPSRRSAAPVARRSRWRGFGPIPSWWPHWSARATGRTSTTPRPPSISNSPATRSPGWNSTTRHATTSREFPTTLSSSTSWPASRSSCR